MGRCRATNLCDYCARLAAVETAEVLAQDAMTNTPPALWSVLTTRTATLDVGGFKRARAAVNRAVRERWPDAEAATLVEFTTGMGTGSGGLRRPHWNDLWKGVPVGAADELRERLCWAWCQTSGGADARRQRVDAEPGGQYVGAIREDFGGLMRYLALHFQKESQQPPTGWRGHRFRTTRGYLAQPMEAAREQARAALRLRRELWRAAAEGFEGEEALEVARDRVIDAAALSWELVRLQPIPASFDGAGRPATWGEVVMPVGRMT
jgi:hypothetical protein